MKPPKISFDLGLTKNSVLNPVHFGYWHSTSALCDLRFLWSSSTFPFVYIVCLHRLFTFCFCWFDAKFILLLRRRKSSVLPVQFLSERLAPLHTFAFYTVFTQIVSAETILFWKCKMWKFLYSFCIMAIFISYTMRKNLPKLLDQLILTTF